MKSKTSSLALAAFFLWGATAITFAQPPSTSANPTQVNTGAPAAVGTPSASPNPNGQNLPQGTPSVTPQPLAPGVGTSLNPGGDIYRGADGQPGKATARDRNFLIAASQGGRAEVEMAKLALKKSNSPRVRDFAQLMVKQHSDINSKLTPMATKWGVNLPTKMTLADSGAFSRLSRQYGSTFDRNYMAFQRNAHTKALALFQNAGSQANNMTMRNFFAHNATTLARHLEMLK